MMKLIPHTNPSHQWKIDKTGTIFKADSPIEEQEFLALEFCGRKESLSMGWIKDIVKFDIQLPENMIRKVTFSSTTFTGYGCKDGTEVHFSSRLIYDHINVDGKLKAHAYIPGITGYVVSVDGDVYDTSRMLFVKKTSTPGRYSSVPILYNGRTANMSVHRLVALAWIPRPPDPTKRLVNHKDGNKHNPNARNLEWTDYSGNSDHAYRYGLRKDNRNVTVKDAATGEIKTFHSQAASCEYTNVSPTTLTLHLQTKPYGLLAGRYEVRICDDEEPFKFGPEDVHTPITGSVGKTEVKLESPTGELLIFSSWKDVAKHLDYSVQATPRNAVVLEKKDTLKDHKVISVKELAPRTVAVEAREVETGKVTEYENARNAAKGTGVSRSSIQRTLKQGESRITLKGFQFRRKGGPEWLQPKEHENKRISLEIHIGDKVHVCSSIREAERVSGINAKMLARLSSSGGGTYNGIQIKNS